MSGSQINYEGRLFRSVAQSSNAEVSGETLFEYHQSGETVWVKYQGGKIRLGSLIAKVESDGSLDMRYQQLNTRGEWQTGVCRSIPHLLDDGRIRLEESWQWTTGDHSAGTSIVEEVIPESSGKSVDSFQASKPQRVTLNGIRVTLVPLSPSAHGDELWKGVKGHDELWTYLFEGPFPSRSAFNEKLEKMSTSDDPLFFAILDRRNDTTAGYASYMRIEPVHRVLEVGSILLLPAFQKTAGATEAMYLMARHAFEDLGYRRYEWKCNALNTPSRRAALRLGFSFEGLFRQHMIIKGRNRDTAWYSITDAEWPQRKTRLESWLDVTNFDEQGKQKTSLSSIDCLE